MRGPLTYLYCCSYEGENVHDPNPIDVAAQVSGEPTFREVGVGPWSQTHPGEPRPDDASSPNYDIRFDSTLLDEGDRRNVLDRYRYWTVAAIKADLDSRGRHDFEVAVENWTHDFNIGSMVRTANAFQARRVHIVGPHKWNRKGRAHDGAVPARRKPSIHNGTCRMLETAHRRRNRRRPIASRRHRLPYAWLRSRDGRHFRHCPEHKRNHGPTGSLGREK